MTDRVNLYRFEDGKTVKVGEVNKIGGEFIEGSLDDIFEPDEDEEIIDVEDDPEGDKIYWFLDDVCSTVFEKPFDYDDDGNPVFDEE